MIVTGTKRLNFFFLILFFACIFSACTKSNLYDKNISIDAGGWGYGDIKSFPVTIIDSASTYNLFINVRHTDAYPFNNIWLKITTILPDSTKTENKINVVLAQPGGKWTGRCVDGICYNTILMQPGFHFAQTGDYIFQIEQDMRVNPVAHILDIGIRLEKM
ncbi:MAG: gliding motility lipoprotein GldH [Chitinophagales bacterium]|nr:gliding motility lipoprotein GldH [Chitinophagales bacterium]